ncbi:unnamed protein product [Caenorhabditis auriculariae]|uniref:DNA primase n=1 Tax=Caenorhabditis auriculariae TaxID=2777116 RepID=A0A8S1GWK5_9PELO|nr:unnamed protein product [Caenorhabditis auriculariae]
MSTAYESVRLDHDLPTYYKSFFPFKSFCKWLSYGQVPSEYFARREFAFILADDVHLRYKSFNDVLSFEKELCKVNPHKLDLGAVYNHFPRDHRKHSDMQAVERELVFDIDLTDYDAVRTCCTEATVCPKCWKFVVLAVKILDKVLREDFGFKARMWVFSGRRGVHCWVGDAKARKLNNLGRSAVAEYLNLFIGNKVEVLKGRTKMTWVPNLVQTAYSSALEGGFFESMAYEQGWLNDGRAEIIFSLYKELSADLRTELIEKFNALPTPQLRWKMLKMYFEEDERKRARQEGLNLPLEPQNRDKYFLKYFVLWHVYPRLDVNVSTGTNHLLKSPFCIHPKTGCVAVPLSADDVAQFDVTKCPRLDRLVAELPSINSEIGEKEEGDQKENGQRKVLAYRHSSLAKYVENFEKYVELAIFGSVAIVYTVGRSINHVDLGTVSWVEDVLDALGVDVPQAGRLRPLASVLRLSSSIVSLDSN